MASLLNRLGRALRLVQLDSPNEDESQIQDAVVHYEPIGSSGIENYSGYYSEEYLQKLRGREGAKVWDQIRRSDGKIKMCLSAVKNPIKGAHWYVKPADSQDPKTILHAEFIEKALFNDNELPWVEQLAEILTYLDFGNAPFEITYKVIENDPEFGTYTTLAKMGWRSPKTMERWNLDNNGKLISVSQYAYGDLQRLVEIPAQFLILFVNEKEGDNYEGVSMLRPCYGAWFRKDKFLKTMAIGIDKYAIPTPYMQVPPGLENTQQYANAKLVLQKYVSHQQQFIMYPVGWNLGFTQSDFDAEKIRKAVDAESGEMAHAFLANFLELGSQGGSGSYALGTDLSDFFLLGLVHVANNICDTLNRTLVRNLIKMNFGPQDSYPELVCSGIKDKPGKELAEIMKLLVEAKVITPDSDLEENFREKYDLTKKMEAPPVAAPIAAPQSPAPAPQFSSKKLSDKSISRFDFQSIDVAKTVALNSEDAKRIASEFFDVSLSGAPSDFETGYRYTMKDPGLFVEGSLRSFSPMDGVTIYFGNIKPETVLT